MIKNFSKKISGLFHSEANPEEPVSFAEDKPVQEATVNAGAFNSGSVVVLPPGNYQASDLGNLITTSGGKSDAPAYWRIIGSEKAWEAQERGTDRTSASTVHSLRGDNITMREHGISDPAEVTYLHPLTQSDVIPEQPEAQSVLVYRAAGIKNLRTSSPSVPFPNNKFFHFTADPKEALLAIITSRLPPTPKPKPHEHAGLGDGPT